MNGLKRIGLAVLCWFMGFQIFVLLGGLIFEYEELMNATWYEWFISVPLYIGNWITDISCGNIMGILDGLPFIFSLIGGIIGMVKDKGLVCVFSYSFLYSVVSFIIILLILVVIETVKLLLGDFASVCAVVLLLGLLAKPTYYILVLITD